MGKNNEKTKRGNRGGKNKVKGGKVKQLEEEKNKVASGKVKQLEEEKNKVAG